MGSFRYVNPRTVLPSQDFLKEGTVKFIVDCLSRGDLAKLPPPPMVRSVDFSHNLVAIDGHNLLAIKAIIGESCLVYLANSPSDFIQSDDATTGVLSRNKDLNDKFSLAETEARRLFACGIKNVLALAGQYDSLVVYIREKLPFVGDLMISPISSNERHAFVHGRFQPFHMQHLSYVEAAMSRCDFLYIGITRSNPVSKSECIPAPHRGNLAANLLTYFERVEMITNCLIAEGFSRGQFAFLPIPIDDPEHLSYFVSTKIHCYTTICDEWNIYKISVLEKAGFTVESLIDRRHQKDTAEYISGSQVRNLISIGDSSWQALVPRAIFTYLQKVKYPERLQRANLV